MFGLWDKPCRENFTAKRKLNAEISNKCNWLYHRQTNHSTIVFHPLGRRQYSISLTQSVVLKLCYEFPWWYLERHLVVAAENHKHFNLCKFCDCGRLFANKMSFVNKHFYCNYYSWNIFCWHYVFPFYMGNFLRTYRKLSNTALMHVWGCLMILMASLWLFKPLRRISPPP